MGQHSGPGSLTRSSGKLPRGLARSGAGMGTTRPQGAGAQWWVGAPTINYASALEVQPKLGAGFGHAPACNSLRILAPLSP